MLVIDLVTLALIEIGAYSPGQSEAPTNEDAQLALHYLRMQLDSWNAERQTLIVQSRVPYVIPGGTSYVTIGPTGDIVAERPTWLDHVNYVVPGTHPEVEVGMGMMDDDMYAQLTIKGLPSALSLQCYYQTGPVNGTLFFWPQPTQNLKIYLYYLASEGIPASITSVLEGPPGYMEAFHCQLAERLLNPFGVSNPVIVSLVRDHSEKAYARMKRPNADPGQKGLDPAVVGGQGAYNVLSDSFTGGR